MDQCSSGAGQAQRGSHRRSRPISPKPRLRRALIGSARAGIFISTDGGRTWQETTFPARDMGANRIQLALSPDYANDRMIFAAAGGQVFRSNDGGTDWQGLSSGLGSFFPASSLAVSPQFTSDHTVLLGGSARAPRVMRSTDDGQTLGRIQRLWGQATALSHSRLCRATGVWRMRGPTKPGCIAAATQAQRGHACSARRARQVGDCNRLPSHPTWRATG